MSSANYAPCTELFKLLVHPSDSDEPTPTKPAAKGGGGGGARERGGRGEGGEGEGEGEDELVEVVDGGGKVVGVVEWIQPLPIVYGKKKKHTHSLNAWCGATRHISINTSLHRYPLNCPHYYPLNCPLCCSHNSPLNSPPLLHPPSPQ